MWGFKSKKKEDYSHEDKNSLDGFEVYTMKDDIEGTKNKKEHKKKGHKSVPPLVTESSPFLDENNNSGDDGKKFSTPFAKKKSQPKQKAINKIKERKNIELNTNLDLEPKINLNSKPELKLKPKLEEVKEISEQSFFGDHSLKDENLNISLGKSKEVIDTNTQNIKNDAKKVKLDENEFFSKEVDSFDNSDDSFDQNNIAKAPYDVKKEYEESLKERDELPNFSNSSDTSSFYAKGVEQGKYFGEKVDSPKIKKISFLKIIGVLIIIVLFAGIGAIGWLWYSGNSDVVNNFLNKYGVNIKLPKRDAAIKVDNKTKNAKEKDNKNSSTYLTNSLNQIKIQSTSTAVSDFSKNLKEIDKNLEKENNSNLIGFNVVDKDNKKLSFRSFCSVISINLPESIISNIDDDFVVYAYRSPVTLVTRFSIVAKSLNSVMLKKSLNSYEANLVNSMYPLFTEEISKRSDVVFEDSEHDSNRIRFFNFKDGTNKSIDYSVVGDKLFIATSMETMHFLMDTLLFKK